MVLDVIRGYLSVAEGLTDISVQRAKAVADLLLSQSSAAADKSSEQISALAEDLVKQSQTNRDLLIGLIRTEVDRTVGRMGFVREEELAAVRSHVQRLEAQIKALQLGATGASNFAARSAGEAAARTLKPAADVMSKVSAVAQPAKAPAPPPAKKSAARKTTVSKSAATKPPAASAQPDKASDG
jgi:polyhydroxyalkanoate synthesis regulator phasin